MHFGAFDGDRLVGIVSLYREPRPGGARRGWRVRGMATEPNVRGAGFGTALLAACIEHVASSGGGEVWCNARLPAVGFYRRAGFDVVSDEFEIPGIGPHVVMARS
ncbi:MAG: GNAT family N-acetyltransferase [Actinomycetota bacterium]|nr:GNAT family N-acetyltransferase [Actinomycetota bacterium]